MCRVAPCGPEGKIWTWLSPVRGSSGGGGGGKVGSGLQYRQGQRDGFEYPGRRPFDADHRIHPLADPRILLEETRVGNVHAPGISNAMVDDGDLAMVAQVQTDEERPQRIDRQDFDNVRPGVTQARDGFAPEERTAAERIHQYVARDTTRGGPDQRRHQFVDEAAGTPDIELHVY
jgi:hypothetical protein